MQKIIAAADALNFSEEHLVYYNKIAQLAKGKLVVAFLQNILAGALPMARNFPHGAYTWYEEIDWKSLEERRRIIAEKIKLFRQVCLEKNIEAVFHEESGTPFEEIIKESRFADLLLLHNNISFATLFETDPPKFVKDVLREAQCPVLVLPQKQKETEEVIFTYNGSFSSMYAIRRFTGLFENLGEKKVTVLYADEHHTGKVQDEHLLKEYLGYHYKNWDIKILSGEPSYEIMSYLMHHDKCMAIFGAYGRSKFSHFFHHSDAEKTLHNLNIPVFITHP
jgi:nucleotide-binding universal stress UspA family protein